MSEKRRDSKNRVLRDNEYQRKDGCYEYRYVDASGTRHSIYSWRLQPTDKTPPGKKDKPCLRDQIKLINKDIQDQICVDGGKRTVVEQCERYISTKTGVEPTTEAGYNTVMNTLRKEAFGNRQIASIKLSDAKLFLIYLQKEKNKSYSTIHNIRGVLRPAFQMAVDDDHIRKNPFEFQLASVLVDDSHTRDAISRKDERRFLAFVKEDEHFREYYEPIRFLFLTGLRISEMCGLTLNDLDFTKKEIRVDHQIQRKQDGTLYCTTTKTEHGIRTLPMNDELCKCLKRIVADRIAPKCEPMVDGYGGFVWLNYRARKGLRPMVAMDWEHIFKRIVNKYNDIYKLQLPTITPHVCRHTYCSNMAKSGMNPKVLQYLMGHSDISVTLNTYTHLGLEAARDELERLNKINQSDQKIVKFG